MPAFDLPLTELVHYRPLPEEPADFEEFWRETLKEAAQEQVLVSVRPVETGLRLTETWDVTFRGFAGDPVRAWFSRPAGVREPLPALVEYAGYGRGRGLPHERLTWVNAGYAALLGLFQMSGAGALVGLTGALVADPLNQLALHMWLLLPPLLLLMTRQGRRLCLQP